MTVKVPSDADWFKAVRAENVAAVKQMLPQKIKTVTA